ncbi:hypothetical protein [uncultured Pontibacter sp.]|uniref:hypothetical protein n=1 Tax=uncultured Pontibacter sp. TaxID=453356 RepID=UPI0026217CB9|nr:hypothetical protein [uncultured Pontibacter sp.]
MKCILTLLILTSLLFSCKGPEAQQNCLKENINALKDTAEYNSIRSAAKDTVTDWIDKNVQFYGHLDRESKWQIDSAVFFNEDNSRALLLLLEVYTTPDSKMDFVNMLAAEKKNGSWYFYTQGFPSIAFDRSNNKNQPYTFNQLSMVSREELMLGGYYKWKSCNVNYDYVNDWFNEPLEKYHQEYLKRRNKN